MCEETKGGEVSYPLKKRMTQPARYFTDCLNTLETFHVTGLTTPAVILSRSVCIAILLRRCFVAAIK